MGKFNLMGKLQTNGEKCNIMGGNNNLMGKLQFNEKKLYNGKSTI